MSKKISVRVSRTKLIASLRSAIAKLNAESDTYNAEKALREKWELRAKKIPLASYAKLAYKTELEIDDSPYRTRGEDIKVTVSYLISKDVAVDKLDYVNEVYRYNSSEDSIKEIAQAIRLLELSDDDNVNTATYNSVTQYL
jgi:hypothetical protein